MKCPLDRKARAAVLLIIATIFLTVAGQPGAKSGEWRFYAGDPGGRRYSPLDQITRDNVNKLKIAWSWKPRTSGESLERRSETTPIMIRGVLYFTAGFRRSVVAVNAGTGKTLWSWMMDEGPRYEKAPRRNSGRGVAYWTDGNEQRILTVTPGFHLIALNAESGKPVRSFGHNGVVDLFAELDIDFDPAGTIGSSSPPVISHDLVIVGPALREGARPPSKRNTKADVMAFDVRTGRKVWTFHTIPRPGEFGSETWLEGSAEFTGNAGVWTPFSVDEALGLVYLPVEAATGDYYGGHRPGANLFSSTLVCVDVLTGRRIWHQQLIHHDIWDYDIAATPILIDLTVDGTPIQAVVQLTKQAFAFVFDRTTGKPVWPIEERPVPKSDVPGEWTSPTQPFPTRPPAFDRQGITKQDLVDFTPEIKRLALQGIAPYRIGALFTPGSLSNASDGTRGTIVLPGIRGGANWESGAADPETGYVYVGSQTWPFAYALSESGNPDMRYEAEFGILQPHGLPLIRPPWGRITAYNMNKGEIAWQVPNSETPPQFKGHPLLKDIDIPKTGSMSNAEILVTKTLLFAGEGFAGQPAFRAYDKMTGETLWESEIPSGPMTGLPMTYLHHGRQYVVFAAGAQLFAYALPKR